LSIDKILPGIELEDIAVIEGVKCPDLHKNFKNRELNPYNYCLLNFAKPNIKVKKLKNPSYLTAPEFCEEELHNAPSPFPEGWQWSLLCFCFTSCKTLVFWLFSTLLMA
jgi:hypothetical protein